jgi:hypothetical protein
LTIHSPRMAANELIASSRIGCMIDWVYDCCEAYFATKVVKGIRV